MFEDRGISKREYGALFGGDFRPYTPSQNIVEKFARKADEFREANPEYSDPFQEALPTIIEMIQEFSGADLSESWKFKPSDFGLEEIDEEIQFKDPTVGSLPPQPMPSANVVQTAAVQAPGVMNQGLTQIENALLSEEEKQIRLRQRGLA